MLFQKLSQSIVKNELLLSFLKSRASFSQVLFSFLIAKAICGAASLHTFIGCCPLTLLKRLLASNYTITYVFFVLLAGDFRNSCHFTNMYKKQIEFSVFIIRKMFTRSNNNFQISLLQIFIKMSLIWVFWAGNFTTYFVPQNYLKKKPSKTKLNILKFESIYCYFFAQTWVLHKILSSESQPISLFSKRWLKVRRYWRIVTSPK